MLAAKLLGACGGEDKLYVDDVFQSFTRIGTGADVTVTTGIDMTKGYMLWSKGRSGATDHAIYDSARGVTLDLASNTTAAQTTQATGLKSVSATGHTVGSLAKMNTNAATYVDWVFRKAPKFFLNTTVTKSSGSNATVDLSSLGTVGMVMVKRTDAAGSWYVFHRSATAGKLLYLEQTAAEATLGHITVSGTTLTLVNGVIADGSYVVYAWAHDSSADGIVQCGSFTTSGAGTATVNLGWEPQYLLYKNTTSAVASWGILDSSRALNISGYAQLLANTSHAEMASSSTQFIYPTATGFVVSPVLDPSSTYIYLAIRRPNKPPTLGTQVYNAIARTGTGAAATVTGVGFAPDLVVSSSRTTNNDHHAFVDRLRGTTRASFSTLTTAEVAVTQSITNFTMDGCGLGNGTDGIVNAVRTYINHFFKRAPGVFDVVCYTGTGVSKTEAHGLGVVPELVIVKPRNLAQGWAVFATPLGYTKGMLLNTTDLAQTDATLWYAPPTSSTFSVGTYSDNNGVAKTYVAYLFATKAGISKVGSYTGNGSSQTINCGFTTGSRFILIKRTDSTGDWFVYDTARGIVAGNDPHLSLNTAAAEVTTDDSIDPDASGFIVNQLAATNLNVTSATYIYLSFA